MLLDLYHSMRGDTGYAQDVRYFATEHMDVRREASQVGKTFVCEGLRGRYPYPRSGLVDSCRRDQLC